MTQNLFNLLILIIYAVGIISAIVFLSWMTIQKRKNIEKLRENLNNKLISQLNLSAKDIVFIGRGFGLSAKTSRDTVYKLFVDTNEPENYHKLKQLIADIEKEEPFDELPDEVKPSLVRISKLIENSEDTSDKHVLLPITTALNKYVDLKGEQEKAKKQTSRAYIITIISFIVGAISFYFTLKSPNTSDIKNTIEQVIIEQNKNKSDQP